MAGDDAAIDPDEQRDASSDALTHIDDVRAARDFAEMIVDTVREGLLVLGLDLHVKAANESFCRRFGVEPEETVGRLVYDLGNGQWDIPELRDLLEGVLPHEKVFNDYEVEHDFEGLGERHVLLNARRLDDHQLILLAIEDVTERRKGERERERAEQEARESEERYRLLVEGTREYAMLLTDAEGHVTLWNEGAERLFGYGEDEVLGHPAALIFTEEDRERGAPEEEMETAEREGQAPDVRWHLRRDGTRFWGVGVVTALRHDDGALRGFAKVLRDETNQMEAERAMSALNETLEGRVLERTEQVRELSRALALAEQEERRRIAQVLHEDLQQVFFGAKMAYALGDAEQLERVLDEALELTRSLSHSLSPPFLEGETLEDLLRWVAERQRRRYGLEVEVEVRGEVPVPEAALRVLLYQVIREILFNVAKHADVRRARLVVERVGEGVRVEVEDEGAGFDPATLEGPSHVGLGLPRVRERLELIGGTLEVSSAPGEGTHVTITVPVGEL